MKGPLVSLVVPVYNGERFLAEALESLFALEYEPFEVIVVDDGSTDSSAEVARSFSAVRLIEQENKGPAAARNSGLAAAGGEFLGIHDATTSSPRPN